MEDSQQFEIINQEVQELAGKIENESFKEKSLAICFMTCISMLIDILINEGIQKGKEKMLTTHRNIIKSLREAEPYLVTGLEETKIEIENS